MNEIKPILAVHGGAWAIPEDLSDKSIQGVKHAACLAFKKLQQNASSTEAVVTAITSLEDNPVFDAGTGSVLNSIGEIEMDAMIMEGCSLNSGAVACVQNIANPIQLAQIVMEKSDHVLLVGKGANAFAEDHDLHTVPTESLITETARKEWNTYMEFKSTIKSLFKSSNQNEGHNTVGAIALDKFGNLACGTSTGGITAKTSGRVGDTPIIGSGGYADNDIGAVSTTGHGEAISKVCLAKHIIHLMEQGLDPDAAAQEAITFMLKRVNGCGGVIVLNKAGQVAVNFSTERMAWAWINESSLHYGLNPAEHFTEKFSQLKPK
ncbi:isoaspartyl peptidase/L-asparaginase-like [Argonauta hians]